jgi:hypothetical protein
MKIQRQLSKKRDEKKYYRYVINIPSNLIKESGFQEGDDLEAEAKKGEIKLRKK